MCRSGRFVRWRGFINRHCTDAIPERQARSDFYNRQSKPQLRRSPSGIGGRKASGTEHTELYVSPNKLCRSSRACPQSMMSRLPTIRRSHYLLSQLTRQYVTVGLSGDGGTRSSAVTTAMFGANASGRRSAGCPEACVAVRPQRLPTFPSSRGRCLVEGGPLLPKDWKHRQPATSSINWPNPWIS